MSQVVSSCSTCAHDVEPFQESNRLTKPRVAVFSGLMLASGLVLEFLSSSLLWVYLVFLASILSSGAYIIPVGVRGILRRKLDMHFLMTVAAIGAMLIGAPAEGAAVLFLFFISTILEDRAEDSVKREIQGLMELEAPSVTVRTSTGEACVAPENVEPGATIIIRPGGRIGLDGVIITGATTINEAPITGESHPVPKSAGDNVYAGTMNNEGYIEVEVTAPSSETVLSRIVKLVEEARSNKAPTERLVSRFSRIYAPVMVSLSIIVGALMLAFGSTPIEAVYRALTLIVISCPCAFAIAIPVSIVSAITGSARDGVLVKGGSYIESLSKVRTTALDKTGTITEGVLSVKEICPHNGHSEEEILSSALSIETRSQHPIARALVSVQETYQAKAFDITDFTEVPGRGLTGKFNSKMYLVGNLQLLRERGVDVKHLEGHSCGVGTLVYVAKDGEHIGTIVLSDTLRPSTIDTIAELKKMGIRTVMLTGDGRNVAAEVAAEVGLDEFHAELLPHEKVKMVEKLKSEGPVLFVGDGINDGPAIASADVGMALGAVSSDVALESADVALMEEDLTKIPGILRRSKKAMTVVRQNIATSLSVKIATAILAALGLLSLWLSIAIGDMGLTFVVIANALRLARRH
jgi:Cd2+/Zn2+-exporting ATPase